LVAGTVKLKVTASPGFNVSFIRHLLADNLH
jgi:hypothetical protein